VTVYEESLPTHAVLRTSMVSLAQVNSFVEGSFSALERISTWSGQDVIGKASELHASRRVG
jgi:hypothetical protein